MAKEKVYKLAQEFKVSSEALVQMLRSMGIPVKSHMSTVDEGLRESIRKKFDQERAEVKRAYARKKKLLTKSRDGGRTRTEKTEAQDKKDVVQENKPEVAKSTASKPVQKSTSSQQRPRSGSTGHSSQRRGGGGGYQGRNGNYQRQSRPSGGAVTSPKPMGNPADSISQPSVAEAPLAAKPTSAGQKKGGKRKNKRRNERPEVNELEMKANVKKTLARIGSGSAKKKYKKEAKLDSNVEEQEDKKILNVSEFVTANELANMMNVKVAEVIAKCLELGMFVTINHRLDFETIELIADEFGFTASLMEEYAVEEDDANEEESHGELKPRPPVVTIMGHVDHGKTSLLDYIRKTNVIAGESGGITQHIAAYEIQTNNGKVTFLDTPGHEAFTAMRARGSQVTDVIVLVVAADGGVMPQTKEAIDHARAAGVPLVVAINKIDLPTANVDRVKGELAEYDVIVEDYGGQVSCVEISAKTGKGVDKLLEILALETEILELKAGAEGNAVGVVIESELDKGKGALATVLVQRGTLRKGVPFVTGIHSGRVRELFNERGLPVDSAGPSTPVVVLGLSGTPQAGDSFRAVNDEKEARDISGRRRLAQREREIRHNSSVSLDHLYEQIQAGSVQTLNVIVKGDVDGSVEALASSLEKLSTDEIKVNVIRKSVGAVKEADIMLASASSAIIVGFHLSPNSKIRELAKNEGVEIRIYRIIYEAVDAVRLAMEGMLAPEIKITVLSTSVVKQVFKISKLGLIAGCFIETGKVTKGAKARVIRDEVEVFDSKISTLKRHQEDVKEVINNLECGLTLEKFHDYQVGDRIETYEETKIARKLGSKKTGK